MSCYSESSHYAIPSISMLPLCNSSMVQFGAHLDNIAYYAIEVSIPVWCDLERF